MSLDLTSEIDECHRRAAEARERASSAPEKAIKKVYLDIESRWLSLAHSYKVAERLADVIDEMKRSKPEK